MRQKKFDLHSLCGEIHPEDGINPLTIKKGYKKNLNHKINRYCKQIHQAIELTLLSCSDPHLEDMHVISVEELPNTSTLMVSFHVSEDTTMEQIDEKYTKLSQIKGIFRTEIARVINRKRTPELKFQISRQSEV